MLEFDEVEDAATDLATSAAPLRGVSDEPFLGLDDVRSTLALPSGEGLLDAMPLDADVNRALAANLRWSPPGYDAAVIRERLSSNRARNAAICSTLRMRSRSNISDRSDSTATACANHDRAAPCCENRWCHSAVSCSTWWSMYTA